MSYTVEQIAEITGGLLQGRQGNDEIVYLLYDSRKANFPENSLFFAIKGARRDGHRYVDELYKKGIRNFVVSEKINTADYPEANFILTENTLHALQQLASFHRSNHKKIPVIGITGSNGKTIVKEWLFQLLHEDYNIVRNPKSYNSQIGVPLSVWQINSTHTMAIFEAGISRPGEMENLEPIIQPTIGILTNIGEAHNEGFENMDQKFSEKLRLFKNSDVIIGREKDFTAYYKKGNSEKILIWGNADTNEFVVKDISKEKEISSITISYKSSECSFKIPFTDDASVENAITCCCFMLYFGYDPQVISKRIEHLQPVNMRLELKRGINHCMVINDSYSADLGSLQIALNFLQHQSSGIKKTVILSDFLQSGLDEKTLYTQIASLLLQFNVNKLIGIGDKISVHLKDALVPFPVEQEYFSSTEEFITRFRFSQLREEIILVKGARIFGFEKIVRILEQKIHQTVLEINLNAIVHNLKTFQSLLLPATKVMGMVKAFAYGSGGAEIAGALQYHHADYLGVAYADEGVELRKAGIKLPIMVMNPDEETFGLIIENNLEPEIYSFEILMAFDSFLKKEGLKTYPIHIEIETGMNRLGFSTNDIGKLAEFINDTDSCRVQSVFTHLSAGEDPEQDVFTMTQYKLFKETCDHLEKKICYTFLKHIANTGAIICHPDLQMDMVRLGIGLYGIDSSESGKIDLQTVATLRSTISQIKKINAGDSVSYGRKGIVVHDSVIATVRIGYADGFPRRLGNGKGSMWVKARERLAPVIGTVCMDMTMIDITNIPDVREGDEVIVFGKELPVQQLAQWADTIPYEIMTGISQRVKRIYFEE